MMIINRLYDEVKHEAPPTAQTRTARIKQEHPEGGVTPASAPAPAPAPARLAVKTEVMEKASASQETLLSRQTSAFNTPELPVYQHNLPYQPNPIVSPYGLPVSLGDFPPPDFSRPPPNFLPCSAQFSQPPPEFPLQTLEQPPAGPSPTPHLDRGRPPTYSNYGPAFTPDAVPSPAYSPVSSTRGKSVVAPPAPGLPLPPANSLFGEFGQTTSSPEELVELSKSASTLNCSRLLCEWTDPHVKNCKRLRLQKTCDKRECNRDGLHAIVFKPSEVQDSLSSCGLLDINCDGSMNNHLMKSIPLSCPEAKTKEGKESSTTVMRLQYRRSSQKLKDPRLGRQNYASSSLAARVIRSRARGGRWDLDTAIASWSAVSQVRVVQGSNPYIVSEDSDHDSDVECLED